MTANPRATAEGLLLDEPQLWHEPTAGLRALPAPEALAGDADPSRRLLALVEPATELLTRATRVDEADQVRAQAAAIERYARTIRLSTEAIGAAQTIARRAEVRIGQLAGPSPGRSGPPPPPSRLAPDGLSNQARHELRRIAAHEEVVEEVVAELAPRGKATRDAVLDRIKHPGGKRRCAGCPKVITGRPNKLYCSEACHRRAQRRRAKGTSKSDVGFGPVPSVIEGTNGVLIATVARLGYLGGPDAVVLDVTYGRGLWWTRYRPARLIAGAGDFRLRPEADGSIPVVCFDPPYISTGSRDTSSVDEFYSRYGLGDLKGWRAVRSLIDAGLAECARVLAPGGHLLVKCMDYVESGRKVWNTFHVAAHAELLGLRLVDRFVHLSGGGPQPATNLDGSPRQQRHAREVSSMLLVFTK